jgi:hypothetical protein
MKGMNMKASWRTVQLFISSQGAGVFEVEVDTDSKDVRCNCPVFTKNTFCKHTSFVENKMRYNNGNYSILVPSEISEDIAIDASEDPAKFREFVVKYAKVEVI